MAEKPELSISVHGPGASVDAALEAAVAMKKLLAAVAEEKGVSGVEWEVASVQFKCDGCGLLRPDRPSPGEGLSYSAGDDFCPDCTARREAGDG